MIVTQAQTVREDLVQIMEDALDLSTTLVNDIDEKITNIDFEEDSENNKIIKKDNIEEEIIIKNTNSGKRIRVYELAKILKVSNKDLIAVCQTLGWNIKNHLSTLTEDQAEVIKNHFNRIPCNEQTISDYNTAGIDKSNQDFSDSQNAAFINNIKTAHPYIAVRTLYEKGFSVKETAQMLERGQGEIELILNLSRKKKAI